MRRKALLLLGVGALLMAGRQAGAQQTQPAGYKDPGTATVISVIVPGGGQMYADELGRGLTMLGISFGAPIAGALTGSSGGVIAGLAVSLATWVYGIVDAPRAARRYNAALGTRATSMPMTPFVAQGFADETRVGMSFTLRWRQGAP